MPNPPLSENLIKFLLAWPAVIIVAYVLYALVKRTAPPHHKAILFGAFSLPYFLLPAFALLEMPLALFPANNVVKALVTWPAVVLAACAVYKTLQGATPKRRQDIIVGAVAAPYLIFAASFLPATPSALLWVVLGCGVTVFGVRVIYARLMTFSERMRNIILNACLVVSLFAAFTFPFSPQPLCCRPSAWAGHSICSVCPPTPSENVADLVLPHSLVIFIPAAIAAFAALIVYRRCYPAKPDPHMKFITVAAVVPYALMPLWSVEFFKSELRSLPLWFVYWTFADVVYHLVLKLPDKWRKKAAMGAFAALTLLFLAGIAERF